MIDIGKNFEDEIAQLLALTTFDVKREVNIGFKKVDLFLSERRLGSMRRIAVECKAYQKRLDQSAVNEIYSNYRPLCESNLIDEVLIVTRVGLTPSALAMVEATRDLSHMTSSDIFDLVMDFGPYLNGLEKQFDENGLSSYYIPPQLSEDRGFEEEILEWIPASASQPIAILGSYGTGKTTLAKRMTSLLASRAKMNRECRIPILVRLGEISSEQSLEGLLGKLFTAYSVVRNYTFDVFMALNELGRFVIFLDGFDEMKHALSWAEFKYNFKQLNRLVTPSSKVIIFGRPAAFLSDEEYRYALKGLRMVGDLELREPDWPDYRELYLLPFSKRQATDFLESYLAYKSRIARTPQERAEIDNLALNKSTRIFKKEFPDLWRRPVQLKMLAEILPSWKGDIEGLTVVKLYSYFIDLIIEREQEKLARQDFDVKTRRAFARDLAVFLWQNRGEMSITAESIPRALITKYCGPDDDIEAVRRDLVSACFLDRKFGDSLFFPHRSFQEFLVAESLVLELTEGTREFPSASAISNEEVIEFMKGMISVDTLKGWQDNLNKASGTLSTRFASLLLSPNGAMNFIWNSLENTNSPWYPSLLTLAAHLGQLDGDGISRLIEILVARLGSPISMPSIACFWSILQLGNLKAIGEALKRMARVDIERANRGGSTPEAVVIEFLCRLKVSEGATWLSDACGYLRDKLSDYCLIAGDLLPFETNPSLSLEIARPVFDDINLFKQRYCRGRDAFSDSASTARYWG